MVPSVVARVTRLGSGRDWRIRVDQPLGSDPATGVFVAVEPGAWARTSHRLGGTVPDSASTIAYRSALEVVAASEPDVAAAIVDELGAQRRQLKLIASENYASPAVLLTMGNWLSDKYAEGIPGRRMYAGCEVVDRIETLAAEHARALFGAPFAYVQPHSGIDANLVAYWAILSRRVELPFLEVAGVGHVNDLDLRAWTQLRRQLGEQRMLGMSLDAGGHLTHGFRPNISGKMFDQSSYGVDPVTGRLDYDHISKLAHEVRPLILVAGYWPTPAASTSPAWPRSPPMWTPPSWWTWPISPGWWPARSSPATTTRSLTPMW